MQQPTRSKGVRLAAILLAALLAMGTAAGCNKDDSTSSIGSGESQLPGETAPSGSTLSTDESGQPIETESTGNGDTPGSNPGQTTSKSSNKTNPGNTPGGKLTINKTGMPIVSNGTVQLSIMLPRQAGSPANFEDLSFTKEFEKMSGVDLKFIVVNEGDQFIKKQTAITSKNLPDVFALYGGSVMTSVDMYQYSKEGIFKEVGSMLKTWAPNVEKALNTVPGARAASTIDGGKIYGLPKISEEAWGQYWIINKKWLEELGLDMPKTVDEFYDVLNAFKNNDPNGNGRKDEEGFAFWEWNPNMWNPWGLNLGWYNKMTVDEKGKVYYGPMTSNFREGIRFWKKCYDNGLIYKKAIGTGYAEFEAILKEGKVGCFIWPWPESLFDEKKLKDYVPFNFPLGNNVGDFKAGVANYSDGIAPFNYVITSACKNPEVALRLLDYLYTPDGHLLSTYGTPGRFYTKVGNKYKMLSNTKDNYLQYGLGDILPTNAQSMRGLTIEKHESEMNYREKYQKMAKDMCKEIFTPRKAKYSTYNLVLNEAENKRAQEIMTNMTGSYEWGIQAIMGAKNVETEWNAFIADYERKGAKELASIYQAAFDRQK